MTEEMIKEIKNIQQRLVNKEMDGEDWEEKMEMIRKLENHEIVPKLNFVPEEVFTAENVGERLIWSVSINKPED